MANRYRGEIDVELDGKNKTLCLTLGGLVELEELFEVSDMLSVIRKLQSGKFCALELGHIIKIGLKGCGQDVSIEEVLAYKNAKGVAGYVDIVTRLLQASFDGKDCKSRGGQNRHGQKRSSNSTTAKKKNR